MKYSEIYDDSMLEIFKNESRLFEDIEINIEEPVIDVEKIAGVLKIPVEKKDDIFESGSITPKGNGTPVIEVNSSEAPVRQRFTIAHELGHYFLMEELKEKTNRTPDLSSYDSTQREHEIIANSFAADLLMPMELVKKLMITWLEENNLVNKPFSTIQLLAMQTEIAKKMQVSVEALKIQFKTKNLVVKA
ncbi:ImmA/IrrE family metallo-endopeptidase [Periweissella cryptocerci]|uniref:ImmA/IrrE family metallo-endopeptidase n=1 Tax=Periweissella cryptocerci TaxID=2506420 RepID=A0A4P6YQU4_9LACO|nr:ImmA/IrrE family metallo-endopeptidase [Periweissella cryptocerci]QBO34978.1 ImmA/IrrE family metallo-endopeptidase [Periweissella cryptocerci]